MKAKNYITAKARQDIRKLAELIGEIIPATSLGNFCFKKIANQRTSTKKFWVNGNNKKEQISVFLTNLYRYHPNLIYKIIRESLPKGIERRYKMGNPILQSEIGELNQALLALNINLSKEIHDLNLPTEKPKIVPPPPEFQNIMRKMSLDVKLEENVKQLYLDGHINESGRKSLEIYEKEVQDLSRLELIGKDLMIRAFNENSPIILVADVSTRRGKSFQEGFRYISAGIMLHWRNKFSHGNEDQISYIDGFQLIMAINQLMCEIEVNKAFKNKNSY
jgi:uncharacterized protein (TIGR02391 family)